MLYSLFRIYEVNNEYLKAILKCFGKFLKKFNWKLWYFMTGCWCDERWHPTMNNTMGKFQWTVNIVLKKWLVFVEIQYLHVYMFVCFEYMHEQDGK